MIAAIMQPYLFPYIGYYQLIQAADIFIFLDDVQYLERGWMNRNRIQNGDRSLWLTLPVHNGSRNSCICEREYMLSEPKTAARIRNLLSASYRHERHFDEVLHFVNECLDFDNPTVSRFNANSLARLCRKLSIESTFQFSSNISQPHELKGEDKILGICSQIGADQYINPIGGISLYDQDTFQRAGVRLTFLTTRNQPIALLDGNHHLSIIDSLMRHGFDSTRSQLNNYELLI